MITPGSLGLLEAMADGPIADLEPAFDDRTGVIEYPDAATYLPRNESIVRTLDSLADRGLFEREFRAKVHRCPDCELTELHYETVCPSCASPETVKETVLEHTEGGHATPRGRLLDEESCPRCEASAEDVASEHETVGERCRCGSCGWRFRKPGGRLRCRRCSRVTDPSHAPETVCYRYRFDESSRDWLYTALAARGAVGDVLRRRGFETARDETVVGASGTEYLLDLYATDDERGLAVIAAVAETPTADEVIDLHSTSIDADAYPIVIVTGEAPDDAVSDLAECLDVGLLCPTEPREPAVSCETPWSVEASR